MIWLQVQFYIYFLSSERPITSLIWSYTPVLRNLRTKTLAEREKWLSRVDALQDEWIIEWRVLLLIDKGQYEEAKNLLLSTRFQKVHQTYTRTGLWNQICEKLHLASQPIPEQLGEDRLANFGAYREFE